MDLLFPLLARQIALLALLTAIGGGMTSRLPARVGSRAALAPALGLAMGIILLTTLSWFTTLEYALWFALLPAAALSSWFAFRSRPRPGAADEAAEDDGAPDEPPRSGTRQWWPILAPVAVVGLTLGTFTYPLVARSSFGVLGFGIFDAPSYVSYIDGYARYKNDDPKFRRPSGRILDPALDRHSWGEPWNLGARYGWAGRWQHTSSDTVPAALAGPTGWEPWNLLAPFMAVLVAIGALGAYAATKALTEKTWAAMVAGMLFSGPALFQIYMDGAQGMLSALAFLPALLAVGLAALAGPKWPLTVAFGILMAGLQASYPELIPITGATVVVVLVVLTAATLIRGVPISALRPGARHAGAAAAIALVGSPRTMFWTVDYLVRQLATLEAAEFLVPYQMRLPYLPGWLAQTREFYSFAFARPTGAPQLIWGGLVPLVLVVMIGFGLRRYRRAWPLVVVVVVAAGQAWTSQRTFDCGYCVQRSLLSLIPVVSVLCGVGLASLATLGRRRGGVAISAVTAILVVGVGQTMFRTVERAVDGAYAAPPYLPAMLDSLERLPGRGAVNMEGFNSVPLWSWIDLPTTYTAVDYRTRRRVSIPAEHDDWGGFAYWRKRPRSHPVYTPHYDWVLTRLGGVDTGRSEIARHGPLRLQRRSRPFDVTIVRGVAADIHLRDPTGAAWVQPEGSQLGRTQGPLTFWVSAETDQPAWIRIVLEGGSPDTRLEASGRIVPQSRDPSGRLVACLPVPGNASLRVATASLVPAPPPLSAPRRKFEAAPIPAKTVRLASVRATTSCENTQVPARSPLRMLGTGAGAPHHAPPGTLEAEMIGLHP